MLRKCSAKPSQCTWKRVHPCWTDILVVFASESINTFIQIYIKAGVWLNSFTFRSHLPPLVRASLESNYSLTPTDINIININPERKQLIVLRRKGLNSCATRNARASACRVILQLLGTISRPNCSNYSHESLRYVSTLALQVGEQSVSGTFRSTASRSAASRWRASFLFRALWCRSFPCAYHGILAANQICRPDVFVNWRTVTTFFPRPYHFLGAGSIWLLEAEMVQYIYGTLRWPKKFWSWISIQNQCTHSRLVGRTPCWRPVAMTVILLSGIIRICRINIKPTTFPSAPLAPHRILWNRTPRKERPFWIYTSPDEISCWP